MCFDICSIWQLLCRMGGFGCGKNGAAAVRRGNVSESER